MKTFIPFLIILICPAMLKAQWQQTNGPTPINEVWCYGFKDNMVFTGASISDYSNNPYAKVYR